VLGVKIIQMSKPPLFRKRAPRILITRAILGALWCVDNVYIIVHCRVMFTCARQKGVCAVSIMPAWITHLSRISPMMSNYFQAHIYFHAQTESVAGPKTNFSPYDSKPSNQKKKLRARILGV
jgi:hypothetical protein